MLIFLLLFAWFYNEGKNDRVGALVPVISFIGWWQLGLGLLVLALVALLALIYLFGRWISTILLPNLSGRDIPKD